MLNKYLHNTVLLHESIEGLKINPNGIYLDCTFGQGGHSRLILSKLNNYGQLLAIDRDIESINNARATINDSRFTIIHGLFSKIKSYVIKRNLFGKINGVLLDLGISSSQIENPNRGFSFMKDGPLDMRMDNTSNCISAKDWINKAKFEEIYWILKNFGEERFAKRIARAIFTRNCYKQITSTLELSNLIKYIIPTKEKKKHPATRSFQAIRIHINNEIYELEKVLFGVFESLILGGRLSIISFHSLECRIIKKCVKDYNNKQFDIQIKNKFYQSNSIKIKMIKKIFPSFQEKQSNPRSRSSVLRIFEKICIK